MLEGAAGDVLQVHHTHHVVEVVADHGDPAEPRSQPQRQRLTQRLGAFYPHHLGAGNHDLAHEGVAEFEDRVQHLPLLVLDHRVGPCLVEQLTQFGLTHERALAIPLAGRDRVADEDEQGGEGPEEPGEEPRGPGGGKGDPLCVLLAQSARGDTGHHIAHEHHHHDRYTHLQPQRSGDDFHPDQRGQRDGRRGAHQPQEQKHVHVPWPVLHDGLQTTTTPRTGLDKFLSSCARHPRQCDFGGDQNPGESDQDDRRDDLQDDISILHQEASSVCHSPSNRRCRPNISRSSSASAWS